MHREEHRLLGGTLSHFKCRGGGPFQRKDLFPHHELSEAGPLGPEGEGDAGGNGSGQDVITRGHGLTMGRGQRGRNELVLNT